MRLLIVPQSACQTSAFAKYSSERLCCCCSPPSPPARENQTMAILQHSMNLHLNTACSGVQADSSISTSGDASEDSSVTSTASLQTSCCLHAHAATRPSRNTLCSTNRALQSEDEEPYLDLRAVQNAIVCNQPLKLQQLLEHIPHESRHPAALGDCKVSTLLRSIAPQGIYSSSPASFSIQFVSTPVSIPVCSSWLNNLCNLWVETSCC